MNLLFYCSEYPPYLTGGIGTATKIVAEDLVRRGHNVSVIGYYPDIVQSYVDELINGVRVIRYNLGYRNTRLKGLMFSILKKLRLADFIIKRELAFIEKKIEVYINDNSIDIFEITDYYPFVLCDSKLTFKRFSVPTVLRIHGSASFIQDMSGNGRSIYKRNDEAHFQRCDYVSSVSKFSLDYIKNNFELNDIIRWDVIYNPIEDSFFKWNQSSADNNTILFVGKLSKTKGCYSLIKAFNRCAEKHSDLQLRLAGKGDIGKAKSFVDPRFLDRVHFLGYCNRERIKTEIDECLFACIPSYFENFSMVPLEIMGRGKTLIYTERTSGREIIQDGINGYLIDPDDVETLSMRILTLAVDHELRHKMATQAYSYVCENFSAAKIVELQEIYYSALMSYSSDEKITDNK